MTTVEKALESVLEGYASFLRERMLAPLKHQSYLVRWVQEFFLFVPCRKRSGVRDHYATISRRISKWEESAKATHVELQDLTP